MVGCAKIRYWVSVAVFAAGCGVALAQSTGTTGAAAAARDSAKKAAGSELEKLVEQVSAQREKMIADHDALARQLKVATDDKRNAILEQMREQKKAFEAAQSALHKQIRDEQRKLRQNLGKR